MRDFIESGLLEAYVMGSATQAEMDEVLYMVSNYPDVNAAFKELEADMEQFAQHMAITPPPATWSKIEQRIDGLVFQPTDPELFPDSKQSQQRNFENREHYIEVEAANSYMKIHKNWKWVFAAVFVLGKIFLGCAIYFYLENRQARQQLNEQKTEMRQLRGR